MKKGFRQFLATASICFALASGQALATGPAEKIDLNRATAEELSQLKGVGTSKANAIVAHRKEHGKFTSIEELKDVKGIGESILESNRPVLVLE